MRPIRVWFSKTGNAKYISHLDLNRAMTRAVRRAHIPLWYTEGFNPHPYITFALPLSLGQESAAEPMDIRIESDMENIEIKKRLSSVMPEGIEITGVSEPESGASEICYAEYEIILEFADSGEAANFAMRAAELVSQNGLAAQKPGKQGRQKVLKQVELKDYIAGFNAVNKNENVLLTAVLSAGNTKNLNPALLLETLYSATAVSAGSEKITRKRLLKADFEPFR